VNSWQRVVYWLLKPRGRRMLRELIITMCAGDKAVLEHVRLQRVILRTEKFISELPFFYFLLFKFTLFVLNFALPPLSWKVLPFIWMGPERRMRYLEEWQASSFYYKRTLFKMVQCVCVSHLYSERSLLVSIGFGPSMEKREQRPHAAPVPIPHVPEAVR
jgi:hypothetical protein